MLFWLIWACLAKMIVFAWRNLGRLSGGKKKKLTSSFIFSLTYCKDIANLFGLVWACLAKHTESDTINLCKTFVFICRQKNQLHIPCFSGNIAKICRLILGPLGMPGYTYPKWQYQFLEEDFSVYLQVKNTLHHFLSWSSDPFFNLVIWLDENILVNDSRLQIWDWWWNNNNISFHFR